jgi:hypothetical protein
MLQRIRSFLSELNKRRKNIFIKAILAGVGGISGTMIAGPIGGMLGVNISTGITSTISDVLSPVVSEIGEMALTKNQKSRVDIALKSAVNQIRQKLKSGQIPKEQFNSEQGKQLLEGVLLKAKDTYEEKKIVMMSNLLASAPFTNTPIENSLRSLYYIDFLTYRQLVIIGIIGSNQYGPRKQLSLSGKDFGELARGKLDEQERGIHSDTHFLYRLGILIHLDPTSQGLFPIFSMANIIPNKLRLSYEGILLYNGCSLGSGLTLDEVERSRVLRAFGVIYT